MGPSACRGARPRTGCRSARSPRNITTASATPWTTQLRRTSRTITRAWNAEQDDAADDRDPQRGGCRPSRRSRRARRRRLLLGRRPLDRRAEHVREVEVGDPLVERPLDADQEDERRDDLPISTPAIPRARAGTPGRFTVTPGPPPRGGSRAATDAEEQVDRVRSMSSSSPNERPRSQGRR